MSRATNGVMYRDDLSGASAQLGRKLQRSLLPNPRRVCDTRATARCRGISAKRDGIRSAEAALAEVTLYRAIRRRRFVRQKTRLPANPCGPGRIAHRLKALSSGESGGPKSAACGTPPRRAYRPCWRCGRVAEGGGLLNRYRVVKPYRGFESLRLRQFSGLIPATIVFPFSTALKAMEENPCPSQSCKRGREFDSRPTPGSTAG